MMALSNKHGWLVLTTGNKSEMSVGYATLYGDMAGGFAVIKDVPKTLVYELVRHRNGVAGTELVPASVIDREPSAELRPDQLRQRSLPPYGLLDRVLEAYVERDRGREEMIAAGLPADVVDEVVRMVDRSEYKRRQAAPGIRITPRGVRPGPTAADHQSIRRLATEGPDRDGHLRHRAQPPLGVDDLGIPNPGCSPAMAGVGLDLRAADGYRADEADADRLAHRGHAFARERRSPWPASRRSRPSPRSRRRAAGRTVGAGHPSKERGRGCAVGIVIEPLDADNRSEGRAGASGSSSIAATHTRARGSRWLPDDQRARAGAANTFGRSLGHG